MEFTNLLKCLVKSYLPGHYTDNTKVQNIGGVWKVKKEKRKGGQGGKQIQG